MALDERWFLHLFICVFLNYYNMLNEIISPTVPYFQLTILHAHLSIPWPHTPHLPYQIITSQLPLLHIFNYQFYISFSLSPHHTQPIFHISLHSNERQLQEQFIYQGNAVPHFSYTDTFWSHLCIWVLCINILCFYLLSWFTN